MKTHLSIIRNGFLSLSILLVITSCDDNGHEKVNTGAGALSNQKMVNPIQTEVDQAAVELLRTSLEFVSDLNDFSVQAQSTMEDILPTGHRVDYELVSSVLVNRPNKLRTERFSEKYNQIFYYNGNSLALYNPKQNVYALEEAPGTINEMLHYARDKFGLSSPISDLIYTNSFELLMDEVNQAIIIDVERIGDKQCYHLLFSKPGADFQIWIAKSGNPLPYKYVVTDTSTPELLGYSSVFYNWNINHTANDQQFEFNPPKGSFKIDFLQLK